MDELTILTRQEPGIAELDNFDEIKAYLDARLAVYRNLVYSEDSLKTAKADKAALNKLKKALDTRRKEIKAVYMEPYLRIETQIKELTAMIDEPLSAIDGFVKDMEAEEKRQKRELIRAVRPLSGRAPCARRSRRPRQILLRSNTAPVCTRPPYWQSISTAWIWRQPRLSSAS